MDEERRPFHQIQGLPSGQAEPEYSRVIDIASINALRRMVLPGLVGNIPAWRSA